ncbi:hypothetical protein TWF106_000617 [Orbilia oligospora]|uniref:Uncharacterized protein n=1 Tax=Orbilia oligospora TaxID=2813651 RepID=A0A6G1M446_ORBOL|nr:hypothetical protein TWF788_000799 [Orbilia oligospora]KAF3200838.1 hypothetical protein TWF679_000592 [Orbilia oligospora]KAF3206741.1 hypothetical protein TWF106_000617 [Orbilia oligospora]KAF3220191.1 hypothetical protein TWF191_007507 [Orbilia oligospora]KAF3243393.1 hypothetical protein TWF192_008300 [Orbilia oligospora]
MIATEAVTVEIAAVIADVQLLHVAGQLLRVVLAEKGPIRLTKLTPVGNRQKGSEAPLLAEPLRDLDVRDVQDHQDDIHPTLEDLATDIDRRDRDPGPGIGHQKTSSVAREKIRQIEEANEI